MVVSYDDQTINNPNPIARFAHKKRGRRAMKLIRKYCPKDGRLLDFGCGPGHLLHNAYSSGHTRRVFAIEPNMEIAHPEVVKFRSWSDIPADHIDCLTCFEVIEHLTNEEFSDFLCLCNRVVKTGGSIVVSVPVMIGPVLILKEVARMFLFRRLSDYSLKEMTLASLFGLSPQRPVNRQPTHKGFDYRHMRKRFGSEAWFSPRRIEYSPFNFLPVFLNSQFFIVGTKRQ